VTEHFPVVVTKELVTDMEEAMLQLLIVVDICHRRCIIMLHSVYLPLEAVKILYFEFCHIKLCLNWLAAFSNIVVLTKHCS
jgi:hypothetical protein